MSVFFIALQQTLLLSMLALVGFVLRKRSVLRAEDMGALSRLTLSVGVPALIFSSFLEVQLTPGFGRSALVFVVCQLALLLLHALLAYALGRLFRCSRKRMGVWLFGLVFTNGGMIGMVVLSALYGQATLVYGSFGLIIYGVLFTSVGAWIMNYYGDKPLKKSKWYGVFLQPPVLMGVLGALIAGFSLPVPAVVRDLAGMLKGLTTPLALFLVGATLADFDLKATLKDRHLYIHTVLKALVFPLLTFLLLRLLPLDRNAFITLVIFAAMPCAAVMAIYAEEGGSDELFASQLTVLSTLATVITIPLFALLLAGI